ncbi:MAG: phosphoserine phosphatase SerB [Pseudomonadota bacterium]|nr:phosphoserine phosphatase SerB [Pseudomonadota bacterium]
MTPPDFSASSSARADLPLAVGPAIMRMLGVEFVVTLISPEKALTPARADDMARALGTQGVRWIMDGVACDLLLSSPLGGEQTRQALQHAVESWGVNAPNNTPHGSAFASGLASPAPPQGGSWDYILQPAAHRRKKLLIADMESTIITCECLDELAELVGIRDKIAAITQRAMNGELNFEEALRERVGLLKGLPESALQQVMDEKVRLMQGAKELVSTMKANGAYCMLVSGGFDFYAEKIASMLGFDEWRANRLEIKNGTLTGNVIEPILNKDAKLQALQETCAKLDITPQEALAVGDGANDLPMLLAAGLGVAYHAKPNVRAEARHRIDHADLRALLFAQGYQ